MSCALQQASVFHCLPLYTPLPPRQAPPYSTPSHLPSSQPVCPNAVLFTPLCECTCMRVSLQVAILCNHQRAVPKSHDNTMQKIRAKVEALQQELSVS